MVNLPAVPPRTIVEAMQQRRSTASDISGLCRLTVDAVHLTTQLVEAQHSRLDCLSNIIFRDRGKDKARNPIAALVYNSIYVINSVVGTSLEMTFAALEPLLGETEPSAKREAAMAIVNGVVGDHLDSTNNPLAISMQWRTAAGTIAVTSPSGSAGEESYEDKTKLLLVIHGSCNSPADWWQEGHNHGISIANTLHYTPLFLHYNSGLHISENGKLLANRIQDLIASSPNKQGIRLSILAHSMGGLVARSACHYAEQQSDGEGPSYDWLQNLDHLITLGSPHHGAVMERGGKLVDYVLGAHRYTEPLSWLGKLRSNGVMDLGYGNVQELDWKVNDGESEHSYFDNRQSTPLPSARCMAIAAVLGDENLSSSRLLGEIVCTDGLVTEASALGKGQTAKPELNLDFEECLTFYNMSHFGLLSSQEVYQAILDFMNRK